jgi:hypothetical protein
VGVDLLVQFQDAGAGKGFTANLTCVVFLSCVHPLMSFQVSDAQKAFTANITNMVLLTCVDQLVLF